MLEAVIFDFDGVIGDTMQDNFRAWEKVFLEYGIQIGAVDYFLLEGMGRFEIAEFFVEKHALDKELVETLVNKKEEYYKLDNHFRIYNEIPAILQLLKNRNMKIALVTGASRNRIEMTLDGSIRPYFDFIVTSDEVKNGKPHPEPYLKAIDRLNCDATKTVVVENAKLGIRSAKAAGCNCIAIETTLGAEYLQEADEVFSDHKSVLDYFMSDKLKDNSILNQ